MIYSSPVRKVFWIFWENEYSKILAADVLENLSSNHYAGPYKSLNEAKKVLIEFLETKIDDARKNLKEIRALRLEDFNAVEEKDSELL